MTSPLIDEPQSVASDRRMPVVCQVVHSLCVGGAEVLACQFAERSAGVVKTVFACLDDLGELGQRLRDQGADVEVLQRQPGFDFGLARRLASFFRSRRVDVVHAHQYGPFFYSSLARMPGRKPPIIFTEHGRSFPDFRRPKRVFANRFLLSKHDRVIAVGQEVSEALVKNEGLPESRVDVIENGVPIDRFIAKPGDRTAARERLGFRGSEFLIVQVARLNALKDHGTAVAMFDLISQVHQDVRLLLVGEGEKRSEIESTIAARNLDDRIRLYGSRSDVTTFLHAADAFLLTSVSEGIPLTLIEAMVAGLPCVATQVGGIPFVIRNEESGLLAPSGQPERIAEQMLRLLNDSDFRERIAAQGHVRAIETFSDERMHSKYQSLYLELSQLTRRSQ